MSSPIVLDWRKLPLGRRSGRCRHCGRGTLLRDEQARPCHKVCAENALAEAAARAAGTHGRRDR